MQTKLILYRSIFKRGILLSLFLQYSIALVIIELWIVQWKVRDELYIILKGD